MLLDINEDFKLVYDLSIEIERDPSFMHLVQQVTLDPNKPHVGLKGNLGLYGSELWWENIKNKVMKTNIIRGVIKRCYKAGQDSQDSVNSFELILPDGRTWNESIYTNNRKDINLFKIGHEVIIFYAHDEIKPSNGINEQIRYADTVIEMAISKNVVMGYADKSRFVRFLMSLRLLKTKR